MVEWRPPPDCEQAFARPPGRAQPGLPSFYPIAGVCRRQRGSLLAVAVVIGRQTILADRVRRLSPSSALGFAK